jgi:hypothetical protein
MNMTDQQDDVTRDDGEKATDAIDPEDEAAPENANRASTDSGSPDGESPASADTIGLGDAKDRAREAAEELLEHEFEGVIKIETKGADGWRTVVELVERSAVPDTQDIIGRYEITLGRGGSVTGYELLERYRRGEMKEEL